MKYINKLILGLCFLAVVAACTDEDTFPYDQDEILATQEFTGHVRLSSVNSAQFDLFNIAGSSMGISLEEWDPNNGNNLENIVLTVEFVDNTPDNGNSSAAAVEVATYPAADWTRGGDDNLPQIDIEVPAADALSLLGLTTVDLDGGDFFRFEWTLNLTNGRSYNRNNMSSSLPGWPFYNSPFLLDVPIVCLFDQPTFAVGSYTLTQTADGINGPSFGPAGEDVAVTLALGENATTRVFEVTYLPYLNLGNGPFEVPFDLICGKTITGTVPSTGLGCGGVAIQFGAADDPGAFDFDDDSVITITIKEDITGACGSAVDSQFTLTKN